ncbi:MAG: hypothetical protein KJP21_09980 [Bacteroidia bacterium]|nr:hypothetical protein [Bacteroidia bacterium]NNJ55289.1 hypothetical protein [Bacteroidia bacterium]
MKYILNFCLIIFLAIGAKAQDNTPIGTWRMHLPYNSVRQIIETEKQLYVLAEQGVYTFDLKSGEVTLLTKVDGFSETEVAYIAYSKEYNTLVLAYENTNIDILKDGTIINLPDIYNFSIVGQKNINDVKIYDNLIYVATSFGFVVFDIEKEDVVDDFQNLGSNGTKLSINSIAKHNDSLFLGTIEGLKFAPADDELVNLKNFTSWKTKGAFDSAFLLQEFNDILYFVNDSILYGYNGNFSPIEAGVKKDYKSLKVSQSKLVVCRWLGVMTIDENNLKEEITENFKYFATLDFQGNLWSGGFYSGLVKRTPSGAYSWTTPQGPFGINCYDMVGQGNKMWVTSGGHTSAYSPFYIGYGYYLYEDGKWTNKKDNDPFVGNMLDLTNIYIDKSLDEVWIGSFGSGLVQFVDGNPVAKYDHTNSAISTAPGDADVAFGMGKDSKGNLWVSNYETERALVVKRPNGNWEDFNVTTKKLGEMIVDEFDNIWAIVPRSSGEGIMVARENGNGTVKHRILSSGINKGDLPNNNVLAIALDKDGEIWVGTEEGVAIFYNPSLVFEGGPNADAQQIIIDDGEDIGFLLGTEVINDIKIDGANRKWIATNNGAWLVKEDGSAVEQHLTTKNSPLPCNKVICIGIVPKTGEVFFGTECGIASFRGDATEASNLHENTIVFPNPVHSNYDGVITITGLPEDATVKIADVAGRVVYELVATGGTAVWDGRNFNGERPQTGVYLIFSANKDDEDALVSKLLLVR